MARLGLRRVVVGWALLILVGLVVLWLTREPISNEAIQRALASRGVRADYVIKNIGLRWQRIEKLRIGDPANPDLAAEWADVRLTAGLGGVQVREVRAGGVRLRGRWTKGVLSFGDVDKLKSGSGEGDSEFKLPDVDLDLRDARVRLDSDWGALGARIDGRGSLSRNFRAKVAAVAPRLLVQGCEGQKVTAYVDIVARPGASTIEGPVRADNVQCTGFAGNRINALANVALGSAWTQWRGDVELDAAGASGAAGRVRGLTASIDFEGNKVDTRGTLVLAARAGQIAAHQLGGLKINADFATGDGGRGQGTLRIDRFVPDRAWTNGIKRNATVADGTPVGPILRQIASAASSAASQMAVDAEGDYAKGVWTVQRMEGVSANGTRFVISGGRGLEYERQGVSLDTNVALSGGGLPEVQSTLIRRGDGMTLGLARIAPYATGSSRLELAPVRFAMSPSGDVRFETVALIDGPLATGRVTGLKMPVNMTIAANGGFIVNNGCTPVSVQSLSLSNLRLGPTATQLCPSGGNSLFASGGAAARGAIEIANPKFGGQVGTSPFTVIARRASYAIATNRIAADQVVATVGSAGNASRINIGLIDGTYRGGVAQGRFAAANGKLARVPLLLDQGGGKWRFADQKLLLAASAQISDEFVPARFNPLVSKNIELRLVNGAISGQGTLHLPGNGADIVAVDLSHNLSSGTGSAKLNVADLRFGKSLQPEQLTRLTLGVVASLDGSISGQGDIRWTPAGVTSAGRFGTQGLDFAAAFGPVTGLKGDVVFNDLLGLATPPGQQVSVATINPGTLVTNGLIRYQLLPDQKISVESGIWPFAGGDLLLDPTVLDMGQEVERKLTFRVVGLDAAKFVQQLEFEDLAASGTFDGIMPMYFDASGGRIEAGRLVVRQGGGTLAYVGDVSNAEMNVFAKLAFDALKSIRYKNLTIELNGPLDGEIVSQIAFNGVNEAPLSPPKSFISRQFIGLPFVFNIKVTAPFRSLLNTARDIQDPTGLLQRTLPEMRKPSVQPPVSENKR